jgi:hypothetical protein
MLASSQQFSQAGQHHGVLAARQLHGSSRSIMSNTAFSAAMQNSQFQSALSNTAFLQAMSNASFYSALSKREPVAGHVELVVLVGALELRATGVGDSELLAVA